MEYIFDDGPYKKYIDAFVAYKLGKGEKGSRNLQIACKRIASALSDETDTSALDERKIRKILERLDGESDSSREHRVSIMRQFCAFLNTIGIPCWQIPPRYFTAPRSEFKPYILSNSDISSLLATVDSLPPSRRSHGYVTAYPVLTRLLLSSGLRISEALALDINDFDQNAGVITVSNSKNGVSRLVPLSTSMSLCLQNFIDSEERDTGPVFLSSYTGKAYSYDGAHYMFRKIYDAAGIVNEHGRSPRIHDMRHTFCTRSLDKMLASGMGLYEAIPILAAYVGHVNYADTEKYIHLTRTNHEKFVSAETALATLIPKAVI